MSDRVETRVPLNINEGDLEAPESPLPRPITSCTTYSAIIAHCEFVKLANQIHSSFFTFRGLRPSRDLIRSLDERMLAWQKSLPAYFNADAEAPAWFAEPKAVIVWKGLNFRMLMHKCFLPLLKSPAVRAEAIEGIAPTKSGAGVCLFLAIQTIHSVHAFICSQTLRRGAAWYCTYFVFQAALVLVIAILTVDETPPPAIWTGNILMAEECLAATSRCLGDGASRYLEVLQRVMSIWGRRTRPSAPSSPSGTGSFSVYAIGEASSSASLLADCANGLGFGELGPMPVGAAEVPDDYGLSSWMPTAQDFLEGSIGGFAMGSTNSTG
ncbi:hypothetical protein HOY80DRAFT_879614 [Tuber brumale]|nr:hypothetical protein HOY80DRAFT_879614 [Tuber brumale]